MTPERLAEIEQTWEAKNLPMVQELLTALREALDHNETGWEVAKINERACDALQQRLEELGNLRLAAEEFWSECWDVSLPTVKKFEAALAAARPK